MSLINDQLAEVIKMRKQSFISVSSVTNKQELDYLVRCTLTNAINTLHSTALCANLNTPIMNKICFSFTGVNPMLERDLRELIDLHRKEFSNYNIRLTKRATLDAVVNVTITRKVISRPLYI